MIWINKYATSQEVQAAVDNQELSKPYVAYITNEDKIDWNSKDIDYSKMYLTIEALETGTFYVRNADVSYSVNGGAWETTTGETALSLNQGDTVRFKGTTGGNSLFTGNTLAFNAYGNIESLEYGDDFIEKTSIKANSSAFNSLFNNCTGLTSAENLVLPATTLALRCYREMFNICTNLTTAPQLLPATTLTKDCYSNMFSNCTSLTQAPELPAATLVTNCYDTMFQYCSNLKHIKCLATDMSATK